MELSGSDQTGLVKGVPSACRRVTLRRADDDVIEENDVDGPRCLAELTSYGYIGG
jgi:hypothetical protein